MEVSHVADHVTHAVIGGKQDIGFSISDSAAFFNILSSTLYTNQHLAVVREVLCNAWDAHIDNDCTERAVEITMADDLFTIRDFGKGIPHDMIGPIYGTYGNSTKKNDGGQTGGFGLGCKAPFAYTDHFRVTSWNGGMKTVYAMSKSSAEVGGKPGIKTIVSVPSTEHGLEVSIKLKNHGDKLKFIELIRRIVNNGEMKMTLNKELLDVITFSKMKHDFLITSQDLLGNTNNRILLRYGNVVYPVENHEGYSAAFKQAENFLGTLPSSRGGYSRSLLKLVLQAPPHSISVTPSRESLSLQEHTVNTLNDLLNAFNELVDTDMTHECFIVASTALEKSWADKNFNGLLGPRKEIPGVTTMDGVAESKFITTIPTIARYYVSAKYPDFKDFHQKDISLRLKLLIDGNYGLRGQLTTLRAEFAKHFTSGSYQSNEDGFAMWFQQRVVGPMLRGIDSQEEMHTGRLFLYGHGCKSNNDHSLSRYNRNADRFIRPRAAYYEERIYEPQGYMPYLRNIVVLAYSRADVDNRLHQFPQAKEQAFSVFVYLVPRSVKKVEAAKAFFASKRGVQLLDMTIAQPWEHASVIKVVTTKVYKKRKKAKGYPIATSFFAAPGQISKFSADNARSEDAARIENPDWFSWLPTKEKDNRTPQQLPGFNTEQTLALLALYGHCGCYVQTKAQEEKLRAAGALPLRQYIEEAVSKEMATNARIHQYWTVNPDRLKELIPYHREDTEEPVIDLLYRFEDLRTELGLFYDLTSKDHKVLELWNFVAERINYSVNVQCADHTHNEVLKKIPLAPVAEELLEMIKENELLLLLDLDKISTILASKDVNKKSQKDRTKEILLVALRG